ncbi:MAG TPA: 4Fe-4S binding protein [Candidatus Blautia intestinigallinarum]|nr:4Fe-4S binding protein [Candidatus Blautia intestinigallinarum]
MKVIDFKDASCRHCYKCVRNCQVKAISVQNQQARIIEEECVYCGHCLEVCPQNAKTFASDLDRIRGFIRRGEKTVISIAPSFLGVLPFQKPGQVAGALKKLGFAQVRETAEGAAYVTAEYAKWIQRGEMRNMITTCCPSVNNLIEKYYPQLTSYMLPVVSPMIAHGRLIRQIYGDDTKVVFLGPCIAKKEEAEGDERVAKSVDAVLTFEELEKWMEEENLHFEECLDLPMDNPDPMVNRLYPVGSGILQSVEAQVRSSDYQWMAVSGMNSCVELFQAMERGELDHCFVEVNICEGGCVKGPVSGMSDKTWVVPTVQIERKVSHRTPFVFQDWEVPVEKEFYSRKVSDTEPTEEEIRHILRKTGKYTKKDELNCGACGYPTCRDKAVAVYYGKAELDMCLPYAVMKAESMANVIIDETPNYIFLTDKQMRIKECSKKCEEILEISKEEILKCFLYEFIDVKDVEEVLKTRKNIVNKKVKIESLGLWALEIIIYIESSSSLLVMFQDISQEELAKAKNLKLKLETVEMAQDVIDKQMRVAQQIAGLLGETTAETKVTLSKLRDSILDDGEEEDADDIRDRYRVEKSE